MKKYGSLEFWLKSVQDMILIMLIDNLHNIAIMYIQHYRKIAATKPAIRFFYTSTSHHG